MGFIEGLFVGMVWWEITIIGICLFAGLVTAFNESAWSAICIAVGLALFYKFGDVDIQQISVTKTLALIGIYITIGMLWSFFKWYKYVRKKKLYHNTHFSKGEFYAPEASGNLEEISVWVLFWWVSMIEYVIGDMLKDFIKRFGKVYSKITEYAMRD